MADEAASVGRWRRGQRASHGDTRPYLEKFTQTDGQDTKVILTRHQTIRE